MNKVILMGNLTRDPEIRYSQGENSLAIARFGIAVVVLPVRVIPIPIFLTVLHLAVRLNLWKNISAKVPVC